VESNSTTLRYWIDRHNAGDAGALVELLRFSEDRFRILASARLNKYRRLRRFEDTGDVLAGAQMRFSAAIRAVQFTTLQDFLRLGAAMVNRQLIDFTRHYFGPQGAGRNEIELSLDESKKVGRANAAEPAAAASDTTQRADIDEVIVGLVPADREMFDLLYYQGLSQAEAADVLSVSLSTVKRRWLEARAAFIERYGDDEADEVVIS
jgi:RNA polymerase sigma-70 factor (ECF subfamily)